MNLKLGSLFDGSGGFPLAGSMCGIEPTWASEVEPYPIAVTRSRFPNMKHLGSVTDINGAEIEPCDIISFGAPCQDLSVAGKRAGLRHEGLGDEETTRSGLFMEAVRIIKEMRKATNGVYPRFAIYENVPGALSSSIGSDWRIVLEELIKIVEPTAVMPPVPKNGWPYADSYCGDGWSISYRILDAQHFGKTIRDGDSGNVLVYGTPQRRRRIYLVADFRSGSGAGKILFERNRLCRNSPSSGTPWQETAGDAENRVGAADRAGDFVTYALDQQGGIAIVEPVPNLLLDDQGGQQINVRTDGKCPTLRAEAHGNVPSVVCKMWDARGNGDGDTASTITGDHENRITDYTSVVIEESPVYCLQGNGIDRADTAGCNGAGWRAGASYTLNTIDRPAVAYAETYQKTTGPLMANSHPGSYSGQDAYNDMFVVGKEKQPIVRYIVRRLTPTECARLQGFPDKWGHPDKKEGFTDDECRFWLDVRNTHAAINGKAVKDYSREQMLTWYNKLHTDSSEYKMWGNGVALPCCLYIMHGMADALSESDKEWNGGRDEQA